jgi:hypothetical protein
VSWPFLTKTIELDIMAKNHAHRQVHIIDIKLSRLPVLGDGMWPSPIRPSRPAEHAIPLPSMVMEENEWCHGKVSGCSARRCEQDPV